jgi:hypothetical protein
LPPTSSLAATTTTCRWVYYLMAMASASLVAALGLRK